jgi:hypothetical protein
VKKRLKLSIKLTGRTAHKGEATPTLRKLFAVTGGSYNKHPRGSNANTLK